MSSLSKRMVLLALQSATSVTLALQAPVPRHEKRVRAVPQR
jgi:hypothetical protein